MGKTVPGTVYFKKSYKNQIKTPQLRGVKKGLF
jgi:hypothetical protein